jgi:hypothetical protein
LWNDSAILVIQRQKYLYEVHLKPLSFGYVTTYIGVRGSAPITPVPS